MVFGFWRGEMKTISNHKITPISREIVKIQEVREQKSEFCFLFSDLWSLVNLVVCYLQFRDFLRPNEALICPPLPLHASSNCYLHE